MIKGGCLLYRWGFKLAFERTRVPTLVQMQGGRGVYLNLKTYTQKKPTPNQTQSVPHPFPLQILVVFCIFSVPEGSNFNLFQRGRVWHGSLPEKFTSKLNCPHSAYKVCFLFFVIIMFYQPVTSSG